MHRVSALVVGLVVVGVVGCKQPDPPKEYHYQFHIEGAVLPSASQIIFRDKTVGAVSLSGFGLDTAVIKLPPDVLVSEHADEFSLKVRTPCGWLVHPLRPAEGGVVQEGEEDRATWSPEYEVARRKVQARSRRPDEIMRTIKYIHVPVHVADPAVLVNTRVWVDLDREDRRRPGLGQQPLGGVRGPTDVVYAGCAPSHDFTLDGKSLGRFEPVAGAASYLLSTDPAACYRLTGAPGATEPLLLAGGTTVHALPLRDLSNFLGVQVAAGGREVPRLERVPCVP